MFARALERQWPRIPSKTSPCLVEKVCWLLGCVTPRGKIKVGNIDLHLFRNFTFRSLSLGLCRGNVNASGGAWENQEQEQEQLFQESDVAVQGAMSGSVDCVLPNHQACTWSKEAAVWCSMLESHGRPLLAVVGLPTWTQSELAHHKGHQTTQHWAKR